MYINNNINSIDYYSPEYCNVAPKTESITLPIKPPIPPRIITGHCDVANCSTTVSTVINTVK